MRAEPTRPREPPGAPRAGDGGPGFAAALRRAEGKGKGADPASTATAAASAAAGSAPAPDAPPAPSPDAASSAASAAARAAGALELARRAQGQELEIAAGEGLRYGLRQAEAGVEIRARAAPGLEPVARADLHAVGEALGRRGVRLARAEVHREPGAGRGRGGGPAGSR